MNYICPSCRNSFIEPPLCTTCGAEKLYGVTLQSAYDRIAKLESALLPFAKEFEIGDAAGELQHWPASEVVRCRAAWEALK